MTPWYESNDCYNRFHRAVLDYERAVREQYGVQEARTAMLTAMRAWEQVSEGKPAPQMNEPW